MILNFDYSKPSWTIFDLFGTRVEHNFAPLWTILSGFQSLHIILGTNLDFFFTSPIGMVAHHELFWPIFIIFGVKCPFFQNRSKWSTTVQNYAQLWSQRGPKWSQIVTKSQNSIKNLLKGRIIGASHGKMGI